jgi:hypothetical protein
MMPVTDVFELAETTPQNISNIANEKSHDESWRGFLEAMVAVRLTAAVA